MKRIFSNARSNTLASAIIFAAFLLAFVTFFSDPKNAEAATTVVFLISGSSWSVPPDWSSSNTIEVIGGGGGGGSGSTASDGGGSGGGGGGYSRITNLTLTSGGTATYQIGVGGSPGIGSVTGTNGTVGGDTWFNGATLGASSVGAKGGKPGLRSPGTSNAVGGAGGEQSGNTGGVGTVKNLGGNGGNGENDDAARGGGGGGAAGPNGNGVSGTNGSALAPTGGAGDNGSGGAGGSVAGATGGNGTEFDASHGSGGGGAAGVGIIGRETGGPGGNYGGGGSGGGATGGTFGSGGAGRQGFIVITYTQVAPPPPPPPPPVSNPTCTITISPNPITVGQSATVSWTSQDATSLFIQNYGTVPTAQLASGSFNVFPDTTTSYAGTAYNAGGNAFPCTGTQTLTVSPAVASDCMAPWGATVRNGDSIRAFRASNVPFGNICESELRTCTNGSLSGSFQFPSCTAAPPPPPPILCTPHYSCRGQTIVFTDNECNQADITTCVSPEFCVDGMAACQKPKLEITGHLRAVPSLLPQGSRTRLHWDTENAASCTVIGSNGDRWDLTESGATGVESGLINAQTTFTLICRAIPGTEPTTIGETVIVTILPVFLET